MEQKPTSLEARVDNQSTLFEKAISNIKKQEFRYALLGIPVGIVIGAYSGYDLGSFYCSQSPTDIASTSVFLGLWGAFFGFSFAGIAVDSMALSVEKKYRRDHPDLSKLIDKYKEDRMYFSVT